LCRENCPIEARADEKEEPKGMANVGARGEMSQGDDKDIDGKNPKEAAGDESKSGEWLNGFHFTSTIRRSFFVLDIAESALQVHPAHVPLRDCYRPSSRASLRMSPGNSGPGAVAPGLPGLHRG
jgi:hypothetical protein